MNSGSAPSAPLILCILDGFGLAEPGPHNAIHLARTPTWDRWWANERRFSLSASGEDVGLPPDLFGNSEVGHLNLGAGRVVHQDILRITRSIQDESFFKIPEFLAVCEHVRSSGGALHLLGLISDGGVHSHLSHLPALLRLARSQGVARVFLHAFLDGRDTPPRSALEYVAEIEEMFGPHPACEVATVIGRYFAMDRDKRWERTEEAYRVLLGGGGRTARSFRQAIEDAYEAGEDDEFVRPTRIVNEGGESLGPIRSGDGCIAFNFRPDRIRQITRALAIGDTPIETPRRPENLVYVCLTQYRAEFSLPVAFSPKVVTDTLGDVYAERGLRQLRIAETEKVAHVTYFFSGGREVPLAGEERILVPSVRVATYDQEPQMSAREITETLDSALRKERFPLTVLNYANADMVGHTGVLTATIRAIEVLDECLTQLESVAQRTGAILAVTSDHGNAEKMWDEESRSPYTAHTTNPVPLVILERSGRALSRKPAILADVAPTLLGLTDLAVPKAMTGCNCFAPAPTPR